MAGLSVAVVLLGAPLAPAASASPSDISSTKGQIASLESAVVSSAARVRSLTMTYEAASTEEASLAEQVAADRAQLSRLQDQARRTEAALRQEAIFSYTQGAGPGSVATTDSGATLDPGVRAEYILVASGDLSDTADQYRADEDRVAVAASGLAAQLKASQAAQQAAAAARRAALSTAAQVQSQLGSMQARLDTLLAEQAAAAAAAAAAARAAAAHVPAPPAQGTPVNDGLLTVVRNVVTVAPVAPASPYQGAGGVWLQLRQCESGDNYQENTGNGFFGAYQFSQQTWTNLGYPGRPDLEPAAMQDQAAQKLQAESGWGQWPACSAALGLH